MLLVVLRPCWARDPGPNRERPPEATVAVTLKEIVAAVILAFADLADSRHFTKFMSCTSEAGSREIGIQRTT